MVKTKRGHIFKQHLTNAGMPERMAEKRAEAYEEGRESPLLLPYANLKQLLDRDDHERECSYRCLDGDCRRQHGCAVCADMEATLADCGE